MIQSLVAELGPWSWWILGLILLGAEIVVPGIFLFWIGIAAIILGILSFAFWGSPAWSWQVQFLVFAALSVVAAVLGRRIMAGREHETDRPLLNRRTDSLIGRTATLEEPIRNGFGRIRLDDTLWVVRGPDLAAGSTVRVTGVADGDLMVTAA